MIELKGFNRYYDSAELAKNLYEVVSEPTQSRHLRSRNFYGTVRRYGESVDKAKEYVGKAQYAHASERLGAYVIEQNFQVIGIAIIYPNLRLRRQPLPLPPKIAKVIGMGEDMDMLGANVSAWIGTNSITGELGPSDSRTLEFVYKTLIQKSKNFNSEGGTWTIEPFRKQNGQVHMALREVLEPLDRGYYDDYESELRFLPHSMLYLEPAETPLKDVK